MAARFANQDPRHRFHGAAAIWRFVVWDRLRGRRRARPPGPPAPWVGADADRLRAAAGPWLAWLGHASFLGRLGNSTFLIDPVFAPRVGWFYPRYGRPGLEPHELPPLAAVLVTHNHYDHLDRRSLRAVPPEVPAVVPRGLRYWFKRWNRRPVVELEWWQSTGIGDLTITLVPGRHWSRRWVADLNRTLWGGFVVAGGGTAVYHAGDSARFEGFAEIGERFPGLAAALLPIGAYEPGWFMEHQHMTPEQAGEAFLELGAERLVPMHWGAFQLTDEPISEPIERLRAWWQQRGPRDGRQLAELPVGGVLELG